MTTGMAALTGRPAWKAREAHYQQVRELHLRKLFGDDPGRGERMTAEAVGLYLDYSKNRVTDETLKLLLQLAEESGLRARIDAMFRGAKINLSEQRAVLIFSGTARLFAIYILAIFGKLWKWQGSAPRAHLVL